VFLRGHNLQLRGNSVAYEYEVDHAKVSVISCSICRSFFLGGQKLLSLCNYGTQACLWIRKSFLMLTFSIATA